jgi:hypothetical protein
VGRDAVALAGLRNKNGNRMKEQKKIKNKKEIGWFFIPRKFVSGGSGPTNLHGSCHISSIHVNSSVY